MDPPGEKQPMEDYEEPLTEEKVKTRKLQALTAEAKARLATEAAVLASQQAASGAGEHIAEADQKMKEAIRARRDALLTGLIARKAETELARAAAAATPPQEEQVETPQLVAWQMQQLTPEQATKHLEGFLQRTQFARHAYGKRSASPATPAQERELKMLRQEQAGLGLVPTDPPGLLHPPEAAAPGVASSSSAGGLPPLQGAANPFVPRTPTTSSRVPSTPQGAVFGPWPQMAQAGQAATGTEAAGNGAPAAPEGTGAGSSGVTATPPPTWT